MPRDTQIFLGASHAGNSDYLLPKSSEIMVEAVSATFTDNGAAVDWCPAVVYISDSGHTIARAMLPDVKVTAGGSAEASFFPGVKPGAASTPTSTTLAVATAHRSVADGTQSVSTGTQVYASLPHADTTDASVMDWSTTVSPNDTLSMFAHGTYLVFWNVTWDFQDLSVVSIIIGGGTSGPPHQPFFADGLPLVGAAQGTSTSQDYYVTHVTTGGQVVFFQHSNNFGSTRFVQYAVASVVYLGTG